MSLMGPRYDLLFPCMYYIVYKESSPAYVCTNKFCYVSNLINLYKKVTHHVGSVDQIRNMYQGGDDALLAPQVNRPARMPKKWRFTSFLEKKATIRCNKCGQRGHYCRFCKELIQH